MNTLIDGLLDHVFAHDLWGWQEMGEPERREERVRREYEEHEHVPGDERSNLVAYAAIKYTAIVIIVIAVLYFLAVFVIPALTRR